MRILLPLFLCAVAAIGCSPTGPPQVTHPPRAAAPAESIPMAAPVVTAPIAARRGEAPSFSRGEIGGITFEGISFDSSIHHLVVVDQPGGPGSQFADAAAAGRAINGLAAINAGFFTPEGAPLGKVIASGRAAGAWNRASSLGSGVFSESADGNLTLARREAVSAGGQSQLLQAGPMLIDGGRPVGGLDAVKPAARIFLLWDGGSRWWMGRASSCTLAELSAALGRGSPAGWPARHGLNLDGGRSADLWVSATVAGGPFTSRPPWNKAVRNFLILRPR